MENKTYVYFPGMVARFFGAFLLLTRLSPFWTYLFNWIVLDTQDFRYIDCGVFNMKSDCGNHDEYTRLDKSLDLWVDTLALLKAYIDQVSFLPWLVVSYLYRLIGIIGYFKTNNHTWFVWFPHFFSVLFLWFYGTREYGELPMWLLGAFLTGKVIQETFMYYYFKYWEERNWSIAGHS